jgi:hypothetical protein
LANSCSQKARLVLVHLVGPAARHTLRAFDDEGRPLLVVGVRVHVEEPVLGLLEDERERVEDEVGAEPDVCCPRPEPSSRTPEPRMRLLAPSAPTTRSAGQLDFAPNSSSAPSSRQRAAGSDGRLRAIAEKE